MIRRNSCIFLGLAIVAGSAFGATLHAAEKEQRPNILFCMADDWGYPWAGVFGDKVVKTPTFDRLASEGVLFTRAFVSSPSCTPSRSALMTGQYHWRLEEAANLHSTLRTKFPSYSELLHDAGYAIGHSRKAWGPGKIEVGGRTEDPTGPTFASFDKFLGQHKAGTPFCYWFGSPDPHRPYDLGSGAASGMDLSKIQVPACFPDVPTVRGDIADYLWEVERFDREVGEALALLEQTGQLDNTLIVMTGDHGMPFPRGKSNIYDLGERVPLVIRWGKNIKGGRTIDDFVSFVDLAPTILEVAGLKPTVEMTGRSLLDSLTSDKSGGVDAARDHVIFGKERHVPSQAKGDESGYPSRGIRTDDYLYIRNFAPDRWPVGIADANESYIGNEFADTDDGPTKTYLIEHRDDPAVKRYFDLAFAKRPAEELYDLKNDPGQLTNVAGKSEYAETQRKLSERLMAELRATGDPRVTGGGEKFDQYPYHGNPMNRQRKPAKRQAPAS